MTVVMDSESIDRTQPDPSCAVGISTLKVYENEDNGDVRAWRHYGVGAGKLHLYADLLSLWPGSERPPEASPTFYQPGVADGDAIESNVMAKVGSAADRAKDRAEKGRGTARKQGAAADARAARTGSEASALRAFQTAVTCEGCLGEFGDSSTLQTHERKHCGRGVPAPHRMPCCVCGVEGGT